MYREFVFFHVRFGVFDFSIEDGFVFFTVRIQAYTYRIVVGIEGRCHHETEQFQMLPAQT